MKFLKLNVTLLATVSLLGCADPFKQSVVKDLGESMDFALIEARQEFQSKEEWDHSPNNPQNVFQRARGLGWIEANNEICKRLLKMDPEDLSVFENEALHPRNESVIASCRSEISDRTNVRWSLIREDMKKEGLATLEDSAQLVEGSDLPEAVSTPTAEIAPSAKFQAAPEESKLKTGVKYFDNTPGFTTFNGKTKNKELILTFDDGPHPRYTKMILKTLQTAGVKANFFMLGQNALAYPKIARRVLDEGHSVGSHSHNHPFMGVWNAKTCASGEIKCVSDSSSALKNIAKAHKAISEVLGWIDPFFRFPYGASTKQLREAVKQNNLVEFHWNIDSKDWEAKQTPKKLLKDVVKLIHQQEKGIVLFHDIQRVTVESLPAFLEAVDQAGYTLMVVMPTQRMGKENFLGLN